MLICAFVFAAQALATEKLVYLSNGIYIADADGQNPAQITTDRYHYYPALSPDLSTVAFGKRDFDLTNDLYLVDSDGQNQRLLFDDAEGQSGDAVFSPDTGQIVFERSVPSFNYPDLYRIDTDGQNITQLTSDAAGETDPAFSADGNLIVYSDFNATGYNQLIKMGPDGTDKQEVTPAHEDEYYDIEPTLSPDGENVAFNRSYDGAQGDIWKIGSDGTGLTRLTNFYEEGVSYASEPTWSPDGSSIVFYVFSWDEPPELCCTLWAMDADGSNQRRIVDLGFMPNFRQANAMQVGGDLFSDLDVVFDIDPEGNYQATVTASDSVHGIARYEMAIDTGEGKGQEIKDKFNIDCTGGCPQQGPTVNLMLKGAYVPNYDFDLYVSAIDGAGNTASVKRKVRKQIRLGIHEPRLGRPDKDTDPNDPNPYPVHTDERFKALAPTYFRIFVPWERLEPSHNDYRWDADVGGTNRPTDGRWYKSTIDAQIERVYALRDELNIPIEIVATFHRTPCWAIFPEAAPQGKDPCRENRYGRFPDNNPESFPDVNRISPSGKTMVGEYKEFVAEFAKRYSGPGVPKKDRIKLYTAWNEPNLFSLAQPQRCGQAHTSPGRYPNFNLIPCPPGHESGEMTSDDYYMSLYDSIFDALNREDVPGMPGVRFERKVDVLAGDTADVRKSTSNNKSSGEAEFTESVIRKMLAASPKRCGGAPWAKHAHKDLQNHSYGRVRRLRRVLDGRNPDNGRKIPGFNTKGCTKDKQMWVTEMAGWYGGPGGDPEHPEIETGEEDAQASCELHDFIDALDIAPEENGIHPDARRVDVYIQYLFQTDVDIEGPNPTYKGFDSGLLTHTDHDGDGNLDQRPTYDVFYDWSRFSRFETSQRPLREDYEGEPFNCDWDSLGRYKKVTP